MVRRFASQQSLHVVQVRREQCVSPRTVLHFAVCPSWSKCHRDRLASVGVHNVGYRTTPAERGLTQVR
jgi:hypothetical protein